MLVAWLEARAGAPDPGLIADLRAGSAEAKRQVVALGPAAIPALVEMVAGDDARAASAAGSALRWIALRAAEPKAPADERQAVRHAVAPLLDREKRAVRRAGIELLGIVGTDADVPALAERLDEPMLAEAAAMALSRIWGPAGEGALLEALATAKPPLKARLLELIAAHREADTLPAFRQAARDAEPSVRIAALRGIGTLGDPRGEATLAEAIDKGSPEVKVAALEAWLALASARLTAGDRPAARRLYGRAVELAADNAQRAAAVAGLGRVGDPAALAAIEPHLKAKAPALRDAAYGALLRLPGPAATQAIAEAVGDAPHALKPRLLAALGRRGDPAGVGVLLTAAGSKQQAVALAAVRALGQIGDRGAIVPLLDLAEKTKTESVRDAAVDAALALAHALADRGRANIALPHFQRALGLAKTDPARREALRGLAKAADRRTLKTLKPFLADEQSPLREDAAIACLAVGDAARAGGRRDAALEAYTAVADAEPSDATASEAVKKLHALGVHYGLVRRDGHVTTWWMIGPFDCRDWKHAEQPRFPEREIHLDRVYRVAERPLRWRLVRSRHPKGWVHCKALFKPDTRVLVYAYTELASQAGRDIEVHLGRDDGLTLWLNGERLYREHGGHGIDARDFVVQARLVAGINRFLVKSSQGGGDWGFYVRLTDRDGTPLAARGR
jgi:HEAT repeat protein